MISCVPDAFHAILYPRFTVYEDASVEVVILNKIMMLECLKPKRAYLRYIVDKPRYSGYVVLEMSEHPSRSFVISNITRDSSITVRGELHCDHLRLDGTEIGKTRHFVGTIRACTFIPGNCCVFT